MVYNPDQHHRHSIRLRNYNYANAGAYFVTICLDRRIPNFNFRTLGTIKNGIMILNDCGKMVQQIWHEIPQQYNDVKIHEFVIMPDHIHGIIEIAVTVDIDGFVGINGTGGFAGIKNPMLHNNLARIVRWFKGRIAFECRKLNHNFKWQRNYHEYIIRNETEFAKIAEYIRKNPILWQRKHLNTILR